MPTLSPFKKLVKQFSQNLSKKIRCFVTCLTAFIWLAFYTKIAGGVYVSFNKLVHQRSGIEPTGEGAMDEWYFSSIDPIVTDRILYLLNQTTTANRIAGKTLVVGPVFSNPVKGRHACEIKKRSNCVLTPKNLMLNGFWN
jgi:hypothetical protein